MKVKIQGFLFGKQSHSWAEVNQNIGLCLEKLGNQVDFVSTDGCSYLPAHIKNNVQLATNEIYDAQISYTAMHNFPRYLANGTKNRFGIWCYEFAPLIPKSFSKFHNFCDKILAPSKFAHDIFLSSGIPKDKVSTIPHGVHLSDFEDKTIFPLKSKKSFKFLMVVGQPHLRKNIGKAIEAYYRAFTNKDDVCLVAKIAVKKKIEFIFEVNVLEIINDLNKKYPNHPELELISNFIPNILHLHNSCQAIYTLSNCEGFYLPGLHGHFAGNLVIAPKYGGQLDFCNEKNSILIDGSVVRAPLRYQYYEGSIQNSMFESDMDSASLALKKAHTEYDKLLPLFQQDFLNIKNQYLWTTIGNNIQNLCT